MLKRTELILLINQVNQVADNPTLTSLTNVNVSIKFKYVIVEVNKTVREDRQRRQLARPVTVQLDICSHGSSAQEFKMTFPVLFFSFLVIIQEVSV